MTALADELAERYDVRESSGLILDVPNPDVTADEYFHGDNPHTVGFGSRGPAAESLDADNTVTAPTAAGTDQQQPDGEPDESWRNADIEAWAEQNDVDLAGASTKAEMLDAISNRGD